MVEFAPGWNAERGVPRLVLGAGEGDGAEGEGPEEGCGVGLAWASEDGACTASGTASKHTVSEVSLKAVIFYLYGIREGFKN